MIDIKLFVRNLIHNKLYFAITVLGFAIALTFVLVLSVYIRQELSVDQFHQNKDRIYRVVDEEGSYWGAVIGSELQSKYPEIECYTRYYNQKLYGRNSSSGKNPDANSSDRFFIFPELFYFCLRLA